MGRLLGNHTRMLLETPGGRPFRLVSEIPIRILITRRDYKQPCNRYLSGTYVYMVPSIILSYGLKDHMKFVYKNALRRGRLYYSFVPSKFTSYMMRSCAVTYRMISPSSNQIAISRSASSGDSDWCTRFRTARFS